MEDAGWRKSDESWQSRGDKIEIKVTMRQLDDDIYPQEYVDAERCVKCKWHHDFSREYKN